jgi:hypothetical protein
MPFLFGWVRQLASVGALSSTESARAQINAVQGTVKGTLSSAESAPVSGAEATSDRLGVYEAAAGAAVGATEPLRQMRGEVPVSMQPGIYLGTL